MSGPLILMILVISQAHHTSCGKPIILCEENKESRVIELKQRRYPTQIIDAIKTRIAVARYDHSINVYTFRRAVYTKYCYNGGNIDPNTGCQRQTKWVNATLQDLITWDKENRCPTGTECPPGGKCWGRDANVECFSFATTVNKGNEELRWTEEDYMLWPYHTCIKSWACSLHKEKVDTYLVIGEEGPTLGFNLPSGEFVKVSSHRDGLPFFTKSGYFNYIHIVREKISKWEEEMNCLGELNKEIICQPKTEISITPSNIVFGPHKRESVKGNYYFTLMGDVKMIGEKHIYDVGPNEVGNFYTLEDGTSVQKSASIESMMKILDSLRYTQYQEIHNILSLSISIASIENMFIKLVKHVMKRDPEVLGTMLERSIRTKYAYDDKHYVASCYNVSAHSEGNCYGKFIQREGTWLEREKDDLCYKIEEKTVDKIDLFNDTLVNTYLGRIGEITTSSKDNSAWEWMAEERWGPSKNDGFGHNSDDSWYGSLKDSIGSFNSFAIVRNWVSFVSSFIGWVAFLLHFIRRG